MGALSTDSLGDLIRRYHHYISEFAPPGERLPPDEINEVLGALLECLPKESGIRTYEALKFALADIIENGLEVPTSALVLAGLFRPRQFEFSIVVARTSMYSIPLLKAEGRYELELQTQRQDGTFSPLRLGGKVRAGHWFAAMERAEELAEEASGLLAACGVLRYDLVHFGLMSFGEDLSPVLIESGDAPGERVTVPHAMNWSHVRNVLSAALEFPHDVTEMEGQKVLNKEAEGEVAEDIMGQVVIRERMRAAIRAFPIGGPDSKRVRQAAKFLHRAEIGESPADSYLAMATALEGLLVKGEGDLSARVADAVAFDIGTSHSDRAKLRGLARQLYDVRSKYIHEGNYNGTEGHRHECLRMVERVVWRESQLLRAVDRPDTGAGSE